MKAPDSPKRATSRRPKFDKAASTTCLVAALVGLGAGAGWRLAEGVQRTGPTNDERRAAVGERETPEAYARVMVIDTAGRLVATYDGVSLTSVPNARPAVSVSQGRSRSAAAATRAS